MDKKFQKGSDYDNSKVCEQDVREMRSRCDSGESYASISKDFSVSRRHVSDICKNKFWKHVN